MSNSFLQAILDAQRKKEEDDRRARLEALYPTMSQVAKRKVFISYHSGDDVEVRAFVKKWADEQSVFIPKGIGLRFSDDIIDSDNSDYVMSQIREKYLGDSSVTIVLLGSCTHSRRYIDWEIKTSLRQGLYYTPNGLIGIILPSLGGYANLPPRFEKNWIKGHINCYARFWMVPSTADQLRGWIEDAYAARTSRAGLIVNPMEMMKYNAICLKCGITHPA